MHQRGRLLLIGFTLSLGLHAVIIALIPMPRAQADDSIVDLIALQMPQPEPKRTPRPPRATPTPPPRPTDASARVAVRPARAAAHVHLIALNHVAQPSSTVAASSGAHDGVSVTGGTNAAPADGDGEAPSTRVPVATASPIATAPPTACARPDIAAATVSAAAPEIPPLAEAQGITGEVEVVVSLDAQSRLIGARVQSSPSALLNAAAVNAARASVFRTEVHDCTPIAAEYIFTVAFTEE